MQKTILITGTAGFIASKVAEQLAQQNHRVIGIDNINDYYDVRLKYARLSDAGFDTYNNDIPFGKKIQSSLYPNYQFIRIDIDDKEALEQLFKEYQFNKVVNLAAQAGVRYSISNPYSYLQSNLVGFLNILECCRHYEVKDLIYASSSSVYGLNDKVPFEEMDQVDSPVSLYAATKKSNELMAHAYSKLYNIRTAGLRFFTVYGPYGRPDMAPMLFAKAISNDQPINIFNEGNLMRDFTYIDDIVEGTIKIIINNERFSPDKNDVFYHIFNIGCNQPVKLMDFISELELAISKTAKKNYLPMQQGDVYKTYAATKKLEQTVGYKPSVSLHDGINAFIEWYKSDKNPLK
ncbi:NAD-dependent epimerase/dehydratase family protein [uncultured Draconibacterium sp.]|uniref:NAD-dependent epimerase/dehydratase family protein n=1 Tax=uncultured Draconibacterium sp. TaxID=1573823 RepID=UPI0029C88B16|nr:NAD-dependent epimerase/dehydratase family protein [uncultured Draconibacterium sp.]